MFTGPQLEQPAGTLSGGERTRLALAGLVLIQLLSIQIYRSDREEALGYVNSRNAMQRIISVVRAFSALKSSRTARFFSDSVVRL